MCSSHAICNLRRPVFIDIVRHTMLAFCAGTPISISRFDCSMLVTWSVISYNF